MKTERTKRLKPIELTRGEGYVFKAEDFGDSGCKITLIDPRDLDMLDRDRYHAVILEQGELSMLRRWLSEKTLIDKGILK